MQSYRNDLGGTTGSRASATGRLAHRVFFERLDAVGELTDQWKGIFAGLLTLRLVDSWLSRECEIERDRNDIEAVYASISNMRSNDITRALLVDIVDRVTSAEHPSIQIVGKHLVDYGLSLKHISEWHLACDVFETVLCYAELSEDTPLAIFSAMRLARTLPTIGHIGRSDKVLKIVHRYAQRTHDSESELLARVGMAGNATQRGELVFAKRKARDFLLSLDNQRSDQAKFSVHLFAANLGIHARDYSMALKNSMAAVPLADNFRNRELAILAMGGAFAGLGRYDDASRTLQDLQAKTSLREIKDHTEVELLEIDAMVNNERSFNNRYKTLSSQAFLPSIHSFFHYVCAIGHRQFGAPSLAIEHMYESARSAKYHGLKGHQRKAEEILGRWGVKPR